MCENGLVLEVLLLTGGACASAGRPVLFTNKRLGHGSSSSFSEMGDPIRASRRQRGDGIRRRLSVSPPAGLRSARSADVAVGQSPTFRRIATEYRSFPEQLRCLGLSVLRGFLDQLRFRDPRGADAESNPRGLRPGQLHVRRPLQRDLLCRDSRRWPRPDHRHRRRLRLSHGPQRSECLLDLLWSADLQRRRRSHVRETQPDRRHVAAGHGPRRSKRQRLGGRRGAGHRVGPRHGADGQHHPLRGNQRLRQREQSLHGRSNRGGHARRGGRFDELDL